MGILNCNMKAFLLKYFVFVLGQYWNIHVTFNIFFVCSCCSLEHIASLHASVHAYKKAEA